MTPFDVVPIPGKGFGAFAKKEYEIDEEVYQENPLVYLYGLNKPYTDAQKRELEEKVESLPSKVKQDYFNLSNVFPTEVDAVGIFMTNCFDIDDGKGSALYINLARINHSCYPNCKQKYYFDNINNILIEKLICIQNIHLHEEITVSYINPLQSTNDRQELLLKNYCFKCDCFLCNAVNNNPTLRRFMRSA